MPKRGLGRAYIDAIPHIRGRFVIMGDADCTYDFREIKPFVEAFRGGAEFVMGSRFKGSIAPGAMPALHRYFGTPVTTFVLNTIFGSRFSDIHCGMRGITRDALVRMDLRSQGWEYASEMVLKSVHMRLPVLVLLALGPVNIGPLSASLNTMLLAMAAATLGLSMLYFGGIAAMLFDYSDTIRTRLERLPPYNATFVGCTLVMVLGTLATVPLIRTFVANGFTLPDVGVQTHWAVTGLWLIIAAFETFIFALMVRALGIALPIRRSGT